MIRLSDVNLISRQNSWDISEVHLACLPLELYEKILSNINTNAIKNMASTDTNWNRVTINVIKNQRFSELANFAKKLSVYILDLYKPYLLNIIEDKDRIDFLSIPKIKNKLQDAENLIIRIAKYNREDCGDELDSFFDSYIGIKKPKIFYKLALSIPGKYADFHKELNVLVKDTYFTIKK